MASEQTTPQPHDWVPSPLGHGETMCRRCFTTNREAAVLGELAECGAQVAVLSTPRREA